MEKLAETHHDALSVYNLTRRRRDTLGTIAGYILPYADTRTVLGYAITCASTVRPLCREPRPKRAVEAARAFRRGCPRTYAQLESDMEEGIDHEVWESMGHLDTADSHHLAAYCAQSCAEATERYQRGYADEGVEHVIVAVHRAYFAALNGENIPMLSRLGVHLRAVASTIDSQQLDAHAKRQGLSLDEAKRISRDEIEYVRTTA